MKKLFRALFKTKQPESVERSPEEICGIVPSAMSDTEISERLAKLYKRYNKAITSLDADLRAEAKVMLDAIADCRYNHGKRVAQEEE